MLAALFLRLQPIPWGNAYSDPRLGLFLFVIDWTEGQTKPLTSAKTMGKAKFLAMVIGGLHSMVQQVGRECARQCRAFHI